MEASVSPHRRAPLRSTSLPSSAPSGGCFLLSHSLLAFCYPGARGGGHGQEAGRGKRRYSLALGKRGLVQSCVIRVLSIPRPETWSQADQGEASEGGACRCPGQDPRGPSSMVRFPIQLPTPFSFLPSTVSACHSWHCQLSGHMCLGLFSTSGLLVLGPGFLVAAHNPKQG